MGKPHRHRLAHGGGDSLDRAAAHVTGGEDARQARLQQVRLPRTSPPEVTVARGRVQVPPGQDKAALVELDGPLGQPVLACAPMKTNRACARGSTNA